MALVGVLCRSVGTVFIDRKLSRDVLRVNWLIEDVLADGYGVVFPRGRARRASRSAAFGPRSSTTRRAAPRRSTRLRSPIARRPASRRPTSRSAVGRRAPLRPRAAPVRAAPLRRRRPLQS